jgi:hypothetical protein
MSVASNRGVPGLHVAHDVLHDDDRVVHDEPGRDRERHQREVVQAVVQQVHDAEGPDEGDRHRDGRDERGAAVAQEEIDDQDDRGRWRSRASASTSRSEARIVVLRSMATSSWVAGGICALQLREQGFWIRSTVSMMLAWGCLLTATRTAVFPLESPRLRVSSTESSTSATSLRRIGAPFL